MPCQDIIYSNEYADYIVDVTSIRGREFANQVPCRQQINQSYAVIHVQREREPDQMREFLKYQNLPRLFGLLDVSHLEDTGVLDIQRNPNFDLLGQNVILGVIDTGIDYQHPAFVNEDGTSRIGILWDQSLPSAEPNSEFPYGSIYRREEINNALKSENPYEIVPSRDEDGHGTFLAGVAAGQQIEEEDFQGVAPLCDIAVVKLKQAKEYLRRFWLIPSGVTAFQETDIFLAVRFIQAYAYQEGKPFVILLGCGTNSGNHGESDYLKNYLNNISTFSGRCVVLPAGNEGSLGHHYMGNGLDNLEYQDIEIRVAEGEQGFTAEFWAAAPDLYTIGFLSPGGEYVEKIPISVSGGGVEAGFIFDPTKITVFYEPVERNSGDLLIWIRVLNPTAGIWKIRIFKEIVLNGRYDIWLPMERFISPDTKFLNPDPYTTICEPGNAGNPLTVTAYDHTSDTLFFQASRGYTRDEEVKPDFAAPGVSVYGPSLNGNYRTGTGTSVAAAVAAGCAVLLLSYRSSYTGLQIRNLMIKGATRKMLLYPNREWGYGQINIYNSLVSLSGRMN